MKWKFLFIFLVIFNVQSFAFASEQAAIPELEDKVSQLQYKIRQLESVQNQTKSDVAELKDTLSSNALALLLFAFFCAWWAKTTGRSSLLWFLFGLFFHVFTGIALLLKTDSST